VTRYKEKEFSDDTGYEGMWRFNWLPVHNPTSKVSAPVAYKSEGLAKELGLSDLHIVFNGYWPERGAYVESCTFKEFEAAAVLENARDNGIEGLVVASAGNTARAFSHLSHTAHYTSIIVVPLMCLEDMWYLEKSKYATTIIVFDGDYSDAIDMAKRVATISGMPFEGGVKNIAKRDGLGVAMLEGVSSMGRLPDHYFQAVGSGAGAIAAWEMSERFQQDKRYAGIMPRLHLAQNLPFTPMVNAWNRGERELAEEDLRPELLSMISTRVLSTRYPAYSILGGVFDALTATDGAAYGVTNEDMVMAKAIFERTEKIDIVPASAVAVGALMQAIKSKNISPDDKILLNITGGGENQLLKIRDRYEINGKYISKKATDIELEELVCAIRKSNSLTF
jgi:cysteate synthase